jgi:hypothetical protein
VVVFEGPVKGRGVAMRGLLITLVFLFLGVSQAHAWFCDEVSSLRREQSKGVWDVCGRAHHADEAQARAAALENAVQEFLVVCMNSADCRDYERNILPGRTECKKQEAAMTCTRLVTFTVTTEKRTRPIFLPEKSGETAEQPRIKKGMSKQDVLETIGKPDFYVAADNGHLIFNFINPEMCEQRCAVLFKDDRVLSFSGFRIEYTDLMETKSLWQKFVEGSFQ